MGERLLCKQEVIGSIPFTSTTSQRLVVCGDSATGTGEARTESRGPRLVEVPPAACGYRGIKGYRWRRLALTALARTIVEDPGLLEVTAFGIVL